MISRVCSGLRWCVWRSVRSATYMNQWSGLLGEPSWKLSPWKKLLRYSVSLSKLLCGNSCLCGKLRFLRVKTRNSGLLSILAEYSMNLGTVLRRVVVPQVFRMILKG
eukprot:Mycagemm_TRINITY_DN8785_c0_g1::TRINITY_DN8785_c0_g1_i1::g.2873::m.2873 type:complete len:107 gc:universal TRINITY_DN8785_c0_g1_i1:467-147(-)